MEGDYLCNRGSKGEMVRYTVPLSVMNAAAGLGIFSEDKYIGLGFDE